MAHHPEMAPPLSKQQTRALAQVESGQNLFITGAAGTGKTFLIKQIIRNLCRKYEKSSVAITATTGIAAQLIGGTTLHSWAGLGLYPQVQNVFYIPPQIKLRWQTTRVLIVDEVSMLGLEHFEVFYKAAQQIRNNRSPFGGIQIIFVGDFLQLPPVKGAFAFKSEYWARCFPSIQNSIVLSLLFRQTDVDSRTILNELRSTPIDQLSERAKSFLQQSSNRNLRIGQHIPRLYPTNSQVDNINSLKLQTLPGETFTAHAIDNPPKGLHPALWKYVIAPEKLELRPGALVMLLCNLPALNLVNGSIGTYLRAERDLDGFLLPVVKFTGLNNSVTIKEHHFLVEDSGRIVGQRTQFPLKLAWAITIHKSQGQTFDCLEVDFSQAFEFAHCYVAMSRVKSLENIRILNIERAQRLQPNREAIEFYNSLSRS